MLSTSKFAFSRKASRLSPSLLAVLVAGALSAFGLQGANAMELSSDMTLGEFNDDGAGLLIGPGLTFDAEGGTLEVTGRLSGNNAIACNANGEQFYFGLQNQGRLENARSITADTIINTGELTVDEVTLTKTGVNAFFMNLKRNDGGAAHVVVNGSITLDRNGWVNNGDGAVMDLNGQDAVIGAELANDYGAVLNINADTTFERSLWNVSGAVVNIADGVTITTAGGFANGHDTTQGGTVNAGGATIIVNGSNTTFSNLGTAEIGFVGVVSPYYLTAFNEGDLTITQGFKATLSNSGTLRWEAENAFEGDLNNTGTVDALSGSSLTIEGTLVNEGELYAETLAVTTGSDGIEGASSRAFAVDNLVVRAGGDFSLFSEKTSLANVVVSEGAKLNGSPTTLTLEESGSIRNAGRVSVGTLKADDSQITNAANATTTIGILDGTGNTIRMEDGAQAQVTLGENRDTALTALFTGEAADRNTVEELAGAIVITAPEYSYGYTLQSEEGLVAGARVAEVGADGGVIRQTESANTVASGISDLVGANFLFFRSAMNDVQKRMGDLRSVPKSAGAWVRYYGGKTEYGDMDMDTTYNTLQVGADGWIGNAYLGLSASFSDGDSDLRNGSVDHRNYSFGLYGGWLAENGQFLDVTLKRHRMETDGSLRYASGLASDLDYYNWGTSVSVEYGWRLRCPATNFWFEPSAELLYGRLDSVDFRTNLGVKVEQDAVETLVGRLGAAVGYTFDENRGGVYFRASVLHDWKGETATTFSLAGTPRRYEDDLGGTWGEFSVGGSYRVNDSTYAYGSLTTSTGSPVHNPWQVSAGLRWVF